jgi:uncharacterized phiE125 gp8 family phage protein
MKVKSSVFPNLPKREKHYTEYPILMKEIETSETILELYTLIPLEEYKLILGIDDRDDKLCRFCLVTATHTIEQYCRRHLLEKTVLQVFTEWRDLILFLNEYPVRKVVSLSALHIGTPPEILKSDLYRLDPIGKLENIPYQVILSPLVSRRYGGKTPLKAVYKAGYSCADVPADLKAACLELAMWNMKRYKQRAGRSEQLAMKKEQGEMSLPENVRMLLEPYRRKTI